MKKKRFLLAALLITGLICLIWIARREFAQPTYHGKTIRALSANLFARDQKLHDEAQAAFRSLGTNAVPGLVKLLNAKDSPYRRAMYSIARMLPIGGRNLIQRNVSPPDASAIQMEAAHALGEIGPPARQAIPALATALRGGKPAVRMEAANALGRIGEDAVPALLTALSDKSPEIRRAAAGIGLRGNDLLPYLTNMIMTGDAPTRRLAVRAMTTFRPNRQMATPVLVAMARDENESCRLQAIRTLAAFQLPSSMILDALCFAAKDPAAEIRGAAIQGLAQARLKVATILPELTKSLGDPATEVREASARGLGSLGVAAIAALPKLTEVAADETNPARLAASEAIQKIELAKTEQLEE